MQGILVKKHNRPTAVNRETVLPAAGSPRSFLTVDIDVAVTSYASARVHTPTVRK